MKGVKSMNKISKQIVRSVCWVTVAWAGGGGACFGATAALLGWNNLGMHCMDSDYSVFSILPPYNTIEAQLIVNGQLITSATGYTVTYEAVADPTGSFNSTSIGKGNFYTYTAALYGPLTPDVGLLGWAMPGANNTPQAMRFEVNNSPAAGVSTPVNWFRAEGIPLTPLDNAMRTNEFPLMRLVARNSANTVLASSHIVLPVSAEMFCRACHGSGTQPAAQPFAGWVSDPNPERDYRLNILRLHDDLEFLTHRATYSTALATRGYNPAGLYANVVTNGQPVLCAACHKSEALQGSGMANIPPLTASIHSLHANVRDPVSNTTLNDNPDRNACYYCHPGAVTRCLRGVMGNAVAPNGSYEMQCGASCHGPMSRVGSPDRVGWFMEPTCQSCHTGTATRNNGQIRYTSVFTDTNGTVRVAVDSTFATTPNTPAAGLSLYRFSVGHGGLQCSACHGSTHAEFTSSHTNDNIMSQQLQGHIGVVAECTACHATTPNTVNGGPHGLHPIGASWVNQHPDVVEGVGLAACQVCHGADNRGTVLSLMQAPRTLNGQVLFKGAIVGCYLCHNGPSGDGNPIAAPVVSNVSASTTAGLAVAMTLPVSGANATLRIISQPAHGTVGLNGAVATYFPEAGFAGTDVFTFAAYNGSRNSALATGTITVGGGGPVAPVITTQPVAQTVSAGSTVTFSVIATGTPPLTYQWQKDGTNLPGATSATLTLTSVTTASGGNYRVLVSNVAGSATSATALLTVGTAPVPPTIVLQPVGRTITLGATVVFTVTATGTAPLTYRWQKNGVVLSGATTATLTLNSVTAADAGTYAVVVANVAGSVTSAYAILVVNPAPTAPAITAQPVSQSVAAGATATFAVTATGTAPLRYQWQRNTVNLAGATNRVLTLTGVTSANAGTYRVLVSNSAGSVTSTPATLTVTTPSVTVRLTSPSNGATYGEESTVFLAASVSPAGSVTRVQFFDGTSLLGTDASAPFSLTTQRLGSGVHVFTARATTSAGATVTSAPVRITIRSGLVAED